MLFCVLFGAFKFFKTYKEKIDFHNVSERRKGHRAVSSNWCGTAMRWAPSEVVSTHQRSWKRGVAWLLGRNVYSPERKILGQCFLNFFFFFFFCPERQISLISWAWGHTHRCSHTHVHTGSWHKISPNSPLTFYDAVCCFYFFFQMLVEIHEVNFMIYDGKWPTVWKALDG